MKTGRTRKENHEKRVKWLKEKIENEHFQFDRSLTGIRKLHSMLQEEGLVSHTTNYFDMNYDRLIKEAKG